MLLHSDSIGDESNIYDFETNRFYVQTFEVKLLGYLLDESQYEVIPTINRTVIATEIDERKLFNDVLFDATRKDNSANFAFIFKPRSNAQFSFTLQYDVNFTLLTEIKNISRITISVNGTVVFDGTVLNSPLILSANDVVNIKVTKNYLATGEFKLIGTTTTT